MTDKVKDYEGRRCQVFMASGIRLTGFLLEVYKDSFTFTSENHSEPQLVMRQHVATIQPLDRD